MACLCRITRWLINAKLITPEALKKIDYHEEIDEEQLLLTTPLLAVTLNPFNATRFISLLDGGITNGDEEESKTLPALFESIESSLKTSLGDRDLSETPIYREGPQDWPLLQGFLRVNLLPFALARNMELLIEVKRLRGFLSSHFASVI